MTFLESEMDWSNCDTIQDVIFDLCDDAAFHWSREADRFAFEDHLSTCPACRSYQRGMEDSIRSLRQLAHAHGVELNEHVEPFALDENDLPDIDMDALNERIMQALPLTVTENGMPDNVIPLKRNNGMKQWPTAVAAVVLILVSVALIRPQIFPNASSPSSSAQAYLASKQTQDESQLLASALNVDEDLSPFTMEANDDSNDDPIKTFVGF